MSFFLERPFWLILIFVLIPLWLHWRKGLTRQSRVRASSILALRCAGFLLLVLALTGPVVTWKNYSKFVVCAVDVSGSVPENAWQKEMFPDVSQARRGNRCVFLPFARTPGVMSETLPESSEECEKSMTNLSAAIGAAAALAPEDFVPEVILYSDGITNLGPMPTRVSDSVPVHFVPSPAVGSEADQAETWIERFQAPVSAYEGEVVGMDLFVQATHAVGELKIDLLRNGELAETQTLVFEKPGVRGVRFQVPVTAKAGEKQPQTEWQARIHPEEKFNLLPQNDAVSAVTHIVPHQRILLVERAERLGQMLQSVLKKEFIEVETCVPEEIPATLEELKNYGLVILSNIPAARIPQGAMDALRPYVSDFGGGLLVIGGDQAFTSGGYRGTPVEELLPVLCVEDQERPREGLALALVVDRSGSMEGEAVELAKEAVKKAIDVLGEQDQVGVHIYGDASQWIAPIQFLTQEHKDRTFRVVDKITAKSGTNMNLALEKAARALEDVSAVRKHIILMTDGISIPADFMASAQKIRDAGISISTIALGAEAEPNLLADIAKVGNGKSYICLTPDTMPKIFELETASAAKIGVVEGRTPVKQISSIPGFLNFNFTKVPPLLGYVQTIQKPESRVIFASESNDPILAWSKSGRGKVVAFTSDMESAQWLQTWRGGWPDFDRFWGRLIAHAIRSDEMDEFRIQTAFQGDWLSVSLRVPAGTELDGTPELTLDSGEKLAMLPAAPGVYGVKTKCEPGRKNELAIRASVGGVEQNWKAAALLSFTDEFIPSRYLDAGESLKQIAQETKGSVNPEIASIFAAEKPGPDSQFVMQTLQFWRFFLLLGIAFWCVELGLRRAKA